MSKKNLNTTKENIAKLQDSFQKRNEAFCELSKYIKLQQHNLPQDFVTNWENCERVTEEIKTFEVEAIEEIPKKIKKACFLKKFQVVTSGMSMVQFSILIGLALFLTLFPDNNLNCPSSPSRYCKEDVSTFWSQERDGFLISY